LRRAACGGPLAEGRLRRAACGGPLAEGRLRRAACGAGEAGRCGAARRARSEPSGRTGPWHGQQSRVSRVPGPCRSRRWRSISRWPTSTGRSTTWCRSGWPRRPRRAAGSACGSPASWSAAICSNAPKPASTPAGSLPFSAWSRPSRYSARRSLPWPVRWLTGTRAPWRTCCGWRSRLGTRAPRPRPRRPRRARGRTVRLPRRPATRTRRPATRTRRPATRTLRAVRLPGLAARLPGRPRNRARGPAIRPAGPSWPP